MTVYENFPSIVNGIIYEINSLLKPTGQVGSVVVVDRDVHVLELGLEEVLPGGDVEQRGNTRLLE